MENQDRKRFINKIKVIKEVLEKENNTVDFLTPSDKPFVSSVITHLDNLFNKMNATP